MINDIHKIYLKGEKAFEKGEFVTAKKHLLSVVNYDSNYYAAYLLLFEIADKNNSSLKKKTGVITPKMENNEVHSCHLYVLRIKKSKSHSRDAVFQKFLKNGIRSSVHYKPLHEFSVYKKYGKTYDDLSNSKKLFKEF